MKIFLLLLLSTIFILAFSHVGSNAYEVYTVSSQTYNQGTMIGNIDISGATEEQALHTITNQVEQWRSSATIEITMRENKLKFIANHFTFNILESIELARDGEPNKLFVQVNRDDFQQAIAQLAPTLPESEELEEVLLTKVQALTNLIEIKLDDYLIEEQVVESVATVQVPSTLRWAIEDNPMEISIPAGSSFSVNDFLQDVNLTDATSLNLLSASIYQLILNTNFIIMERHIGTELPTDIPLGYEAKIDSDLGWDFVFYNPNREDFILQINQMEGSTQLNLLGYPFSNSYEIELINQKTFTPKVIKQFDSSLLPGETKESFSGKSGSYVEIMRKVISEDNKIVESELISRDYYPPQHRIVLVGQ